MSTCAYLSFSRSVGGQVKRKEGSEESVAVVVAFHAEQLHYLRVTISSAFDSP